METRSDPGRWLSARQITKTAASCEHADPDLPEGALRQRIRELTLLNHLSNLLQICYTEENTYGIVSSICKKLFPKDSGCLGIMEPSAGLRIVDFWGTPPTKNLNTDGANGRDAHPCGSEERSGLKSLCPHLRFCPDHDCLCVPIGATDDMLGALSLCFRAYEADNRNGKRFQAMEPKRKLLAQVAEEYSLALVNLRLRETLRLESIRDPLTGLYNRRYMEESLEREAYRAKRHNTPIGIMMLDIDHFKQFNDTYGHAGGDAILQALGMFLQQHVRGEDIACRYGGDEFLLILPEATLEVSGKRAEELRASAQQLPIPYKGHILQITISIGLSVLANEFDIQSALSAADKALYHAKNNGRNQVVMT